MKKENIFDVFERVHKNDPKPDKIRGEVTPLDITPEQEQDPEQEPEQEPEQTQNGGEEDGV